MRWLESITNSMDMNVSKLQEIVEDRGTWQPPGSKTVGQTQKANNWGSGFVTLQGT